MGRVILSILTWTKHLLWKMKNSFPIKTFRKSNRIIARKSVHPAQTFRSIVCSFVRPTEMKWTKWRKLLSNFMKLSQSVFSVHQKKGRTYNKLVENGNWCSGELVRDHSIYQSIDRRSTRFQLWTSFSRARLLSNKFPITKCNFCKSQPVLISWQTSVRHCPLINQTYNLIASI